MAQTYVLVDGENIDATLGQSILARRPQPQERPRWDRLLTWAEDLWDQPVSGLFFLAVNGEMPMSFVQALTALGYKPIPLSGSPDQKVVDIAIQRTLEALKERDGDVLLASGDGDFIPQMTDLLGSRRTGLIAFNELRNGAWAGLADRGLELYDLEYDVRAFNTELPRLRVIAIDEFDPLQFL
ncbi:nuclease [Aeromicrobium sp. Root495]|uniref:NYN domain-containing protein n=1 Tax=Aeromicrobium sp. Root495 TaxID=1736550 RepID=UPI0007009A3A|nr:NYN domain-containing protein [Aeromicrobium sp. Root495]KQY58185.1 nuclease [Aeromicrobium sp. Root495]RYJ07549.1 MAG: NYN domain-containing protein [Actinomycetales bacterium]